MMLLEWYVNVLMKHFFPETEQLHKRFCCLLFYSSAHMQTNHYLVTKWNQAFLKKQTKKVLQIFITTNQDSDFSLN